eukprot:TRINITY_DN63207_c0_g1_i1.p1 TRINITY_DN63207_c0_g1~~TRINITY_DN63207_c0_g1_i1.p1  ORF type:complete len:249 (+),score=70.67 TRINITY_DN63207_c0_g1_i1:111-749(+)
MAAVIAADAEQRCLIEVVGEHRDALEQAASELEASDEAAAQLLRAVLELRGVDQKRLRNLGKRLREIEALKARDPASLDAQAREKVSHEEKYRKEIEDIEKADVPGGFNDQEMTRLVASGRTTLSRAAAGLKDAHHDAVSVLSAWANEYVGSAERRCKRLQKKLTEIERLREKPKGSLDEAALQKIAAEPRILAEVARLRALADEVASRGGC